jgi:hypothetical protein
MVESIGVAAVCYNGQLSTHSYPSTKNDVELRW